MLLRYLIGLIFWWWNIHHEKGYIFLRFQLLLSWCLNELAKQTNSICEMTHQITSISRCILLKKVTTSTIKNASLLASLASNTKRWFRAAISGPAMCQNRVIFGSEVTIAHRDNIIILLSYQTIFYFFFIIVSLASLFCTI